MLVQAAPERADVAPPPSPERLRSVLQLVGSVVAPTSLLTALLIYFGWAHSAAFMRYYGVDMSLLGLSTQDYLMRSVDVLFVPLTVACSGAVVLLWVGREAKARLLAGPGGVRRARWAAIGVGALGLLLLGVGFAGIFWVDPPASYSLRYPLSFGAGTVLIEYASRLLAGPRRVTGLFEVAAAFVLVSLSLFWASTNYAAEVGRSRAMQFEREFRSSPEAVLYSTEALYLDAPGVVETACDAATGGFRFRYSGLRLMIRSAGQYFLLPEAWSPDSGVAIVVPESDGVRLQFGLGPSVTPRPC